MWPAAAVSGFYFSHPESTYFAVGRIDRDQAADYARRKGMDLATAERWLAPNFGYTRIFATGMARRVNRSLPMTVLVPLRGTLWLGKPSPHSTKRSPYETYRYPVELPVRPRPYRRRPG